MIGKKVGPQSNYETVDFEVNAFCLYTATFQKMTFEIQGAHGSCPYFVKSLLCKHIIGIAALNRSMEIPDNLNAQRLTTAAKRGRPCLIGRAL